LWAGHPAKKVKAHGHSNDHNHMQHLQSGHTIDSTLSASLATSFRRSKWDSQEDGMQARTKNTANCHPPCAPSHSNWPTGIWDKRVMPMAQTAAQSNPPRNARDPSAWRQREQPEGSGQQDSLQPARPKKIQEQDPPTNLPRKPIVVSHARQPGPAALPGPPAHGLADPCTRALADASADLSSIFAPGSCQANRNV
jgi:hypothetical protein